MRMRMHNVAAVVSERASTEPMCAHGRAGEDWGGEDWTSRGASDEHALALVITACG